MTWLRYVAPIGSVLFLTLIAALPWGLPAEDRFFLPLMPVIAIHYWTLRHDAWLPEWVVFLAGLTLDVLTNGPLGYWALIYLLIQLIATLSAPLAKNGSIARLALLALAVVAVTAVAWAVASLYFLELVDWAPYALGAGFALVGALFLLPVLRMLDAGAERRGNSLLARGL